MTSNLWSSEKDLSRFSPQNIWNDESKLRLAARWPHGHKACLRCPPTPAWVPPRLWAAELYPQAARWPIFSLRDKIPPDQQIVKQPPCLLSVSGVVQPQERNRWIKTA